MIKYGGQANAKITAAATNTLDISPGLSTNQDIVWVCGKAGTAGMVALATAPPGDASSVPVQHLPSACHA